MNKIIHGDCLEEMKNIQDNSIDMILCDLPYGTTACKWDTIIPFEPLWEQYKRIIKDKGAIVLTASQPFTSALVMSNPKMFKYTWVWEKMIPSNFMNAKKMPLFGFEDICVFYKKLPTYHPQMREGKPFIDKRSRGRFEGKDAFGSLPGHYPQDNKGTRYPNGIISISARNNSPLHPTQKPVALFEYLIKTYTNEGDTVLDNCAGSGTTGIACQNTNRNYILIEKDTVYFEIIKNRIYETNGHSKRNSSEARE